MGKKKTTKNLTKKYIYLYSYQLVLYEPRERKRKACWKRGGTNGSYGHSKGNVILQSGC